MHARFFDVLHDAGDQHVAVLIGERIDIHFGGVFEESIDQHRPLLRENHGFVHIAPHHLFVVGDHHGAAAEHVAGAHQHRITDAASHGASFFRRWWPCRWRAKEFAARRAACRKVCDPRPDRCPRDRCR